MALTALCSAVPIGASAGVPEWVHLLPTGAVRTNDGRGPYRTPADLAGLIAQSMKGAGGKLVLDENHATDLAAPKGASAPARAWIVELQARADGIWGRAEWTPTGRQLMEAGEYRGISPVIAHRRDGTITAILRASLTNTPNLQGLTALHSQESEPMDFRALLIEALGLDDDADDAAIAAALKAKMEKPAAPAEAEAKALQAALAPIGAALGLQAGAGADAILISVNAMKAGGDETVQALQSTVTNLSTKLDQLTEAGSRERAETFVDGEIAAGRIGLKPMRDDMIALHMANPAQATKIIGNLPKVRTGAMEGRDVQRKPGELSDAEKTVVQLMGVDPAEFVKNRAPGADRVEVL